MLLCDWMEVTDIHCTVNAHCSIHGFSEAITMNNWLYTKSEIRQLNLVVYSILKVKLDSSTEWFIIY